MNNYAQNWIRLGSLAQYRGDCPRRLLRLQGRHDLAMP